MVWKVLPTGELETPVQWAPRSASAGDEYGARLQFSLDAAGWKEAGRFSLERIGCRNSNEQLAKPYDKTRFYLRVFCSSDEDVKTAPPRSGLVTKTAAKKGKIPEVRTK